MSATDVSPLIATCATICWASTSSGLRRKRVDSIVAVDHPPHDDRRLEQVAAVLRVERALARLADGVAGAADPLQPATHRTRRLDLDDEVDGAHVDAELEAARRDDAAQHAALQLVLDDDALLARQRAVVRLDEIDRVGRVVVVPRVVVGGADALVLVRARSASPRAAPPGGASW